MPGLVPTQRMACAGLGGMAVVCGDVGKGAAARGDCTKMMQREVVLLGEGGSLRLLLWVGVDWDAPARMVWIRWIEIPSGRAGS